MSVPKKWTWCRLPGVPLQSPPYNADGVGEDGCPPLQRILPIPNALLARSYQDLTVLWRPEGNQPIDMAALQTKLFNSFEHTVCLVSHTTQERRFSLPNAPSKFLGNLRLTTAESVELPKIWEHGVWELKRSVGNTKQCLEESPLPDIVVSIYLYAAKGTNFWSSGPTRPGMTCWSVLSLTEDILDQKYAWMKQIESLQWQEP